MVCVAQDEQNYDPYTTSIQVEIHDGKLQALGTTLGADNGIGMALMMAAADISDRPDLELLFTVDEER